MTLDVRPGRVTGEDPFRVALAGDPAEGLPCERVGDVDDTGRGAVLTTPTGRLWLGPYGPQNPLPALGDRVAAVERQAVAVARSVNVAARRASSAESAVGAAVTEAHQAALAAASANGTIIIDASDPLPTTRTNGAPLVGGELLYIVGDTPATATTIEQVRIYLGGQWIPHAYAAAYIIATESITGPLLAADALNFKEAEGLDIYSPNKTATPRLHIGGSVFEVIRSTVDGEYRSTQIGGSDADEHVLFDAAGNPMSGFHADGSGRTRGEHSVGSLRVAGTLLEDWLDPLPKGLLARYETTTESPKAGSTSIGLVRWGQLPIVEGRVYRIKLSGSLQTTATTANAHFAVSYKNGGSSITITENVLIRNIYRGVSSSDSMRTADWETYWVAPFTNLWSGKILVSMRCNITDHAVWLFGGSGSGWAVSIEDLGVHVAREGELSLAGGVPFEAWTPAEPPTRQTFTTEYTATWTRSWRGGSTVTDSLHHGWYGGYQRYSMAGFPAQMATDLAGATILKTEVYLDNESWYYNNGGTALIGRSTATTAPASPQTSGGSPFAAAGWTRGSGRWVTAPAGWWTASHRAITLGEGAGTNYTNYGKFALAPVKIRHTYTKG